MIKIEADKINQIQVIGVSRNKVLIVTLSNSSSPLVVKSEETQAEIGGKLDTRTSVGSMLEFHGTLFSKLRALPFDVKGLMDSEINALRTVSQNDIVGLGGHETWPAFFDHHMIQMNGAQKDIVKISYVEALANLNGMAQKAEEIGLIRAALEHGSTTFVYELGEILAVDFFIGNHDRFSYKGLFTGPQNIFFSTKNGRVRATGIDTYDIFGYWSDLNKTIEQIEDENPLERWPGRVLAPGNVQDRDAIARNAINDILKWAYEGGVKPDENSSIAPCLISDSRKSDLVKLFHKGMSAAKSTLRKKYHLSDNQSALKDGIRSRWKIIRG